jgi:hypothetical protein
MAAADGITPARNRSVPCPLCGGPVAASGAAGEANVCVACATWQSQSRRERVRSTRTRSRQAGRFAGR